MTLLEHLASDANWLVAHWASAVTRFADLVFSHPIIDSFVAVVLWLMTFYLVWVRESTG